MATDPHQPLRDDVRRLGRILGDTIIEQAGRDVFEIVEKVRKSAKAGRAGDEQATAELSETLNALPVDQAMPVARAFAQFLSLANIAEQHHRVRRRRDHRRDPDSPPQRGSIEEALLRLKAHGIHPDEIHRAASTLHIELVFTAHPTEITRRTLLSKHQRIAASLGTLDRADLLPEERADAEDTLRREVAALWTTSEIRRTRPTPEDEARGGFAVIEKVLWDAVPEHLAAFDRLLTAHTGRGLPLDAAPLTFGSWMGGDRDGNPSVTPEVTTRVVLLARWMAAELYRREIDLLRNELSMDRGSPELQRHVDGAPEPYRIVLRTVRDHLVGTKAQIEALLDKKDPPGLPHYDDATPLREALLLLHRSLHHTGLGVIAAGRLTRILRRLACFGLHLVRLDLRQEADRHTEALAAITHATGHGDYDTWDENRRQDFLVRSLQEGLHVPIGLDGPPGVHDVLDTFQAAAASPRQALGAYVISMAAAPSDVLAVEVLQRWAGIDPPMRVVPLFETQQDLERAADTVGRLLAVPALCERATRDGLEVMIGYSDSAKDAGILTAAWALYRAQEALVATGERHGVALTLFHGRGGSVGRGGGPAHAAITGLPRGAVPGRLRVTEQGEVIHARFGLPGIALRTLELYTTGVLEATLLPPDPPRAEWRSLMDEIAHAAERAYRGAVQEDPGFVPYFRAATPEQELGALNIGSRPARRRAHGGLETLRAIPWVFAWTQNRLIIPSWLGVGEGLAAGRARDEAVVGAMHRDWPFFTTLIDLIEMGLAKTTPWIARRYHDTLVDPHERPVGERLFARLETTMDEVKQLVGHQRLVEHNAVLRRSIDVRNPYVDPLNLLQIELLGRVRSEPDERLQNALLVTMNGVAQGMRNTG